MGACWQPTRCGAGLRWLPVEFGRVQGTGHSTVARYRVQDGRRRGRHGREGVGVVGATSAHRQQPGCRAGWCGWAEGLFGTEARKTEVGWQ